MPEILDTTTVVEVLLREPIARVVRRDRMIRPLLHLLGVHGAIQVVIKTKDNDELTLLSCLSDDQLDQVISLHRGDFFAVPRRAMTIALGEHHQDAEVLRGRLEGSALITWGSAAGREYDRFIASGTYKPENDADHHHYLPGYFPVPATVRR